MIFMAFFFAFKRLPLNLPLSGVGQVSCLLTVTGLRLEMAYCGRVWKSKTPDFRRGL
jgi:hypothetical protein